MFYFISDNQIQGFSPDNQTALPAGWIMVEAEEVEGKIATWIPDAQLIEFQDPPAIPLFQPVPQAHTANWLGLESALRNSTAWAHAYSQSEETVKANAAFTLLLTSLTATHNEDDLRFAWLRLRELMGTQSSLTDFSEEQLAFVAEALTDNGFDPASFGLG